MLPAFERSRDIERRPQRGRDILGRRASTQRIIGIGCALADGRDVEAQNGSGQKAHIGQHRKPTADARVMVEEAHAFGFEQIAKAVFARP